ncbi:MAG: ATP-NAD kinase [Gammaproteobacteria bacterium]|nr:ATP-NAD kinase [Gammaproteobacteria bacterium]MBT5681318.1 ATP-NAD kinase [Gammaproteobacteria bacterium]MBT6025935.1 ATP-NAD kinase [Gammaproteobacteria bacterium]
MLLNPLAGIGGAVGLKGSDGIELQALAKQRSGTPQAAMRTQVFLQQLNTLLGSQTEQIQWFTWAEEMGASALALAGLDAQVLGRSEGPSSGHDSQVAASTLSAEGIDLLVFAGGDGTARDVLLGVNAQTTVLGLPSGVKMHSGVFAISPAAAAEVVAALAVGGLVGRMAREVRDYVPINKSKDEDSLQAPRAVGTQHFGDLWVPESSGFLQQMKIGGMEDESLVVAEITNYMLDEFGADQERAYIFGPGSTCLSIKQAFGIEGTLLGCDVLLPGGDILLDQTAADLLALSQTQRLHLIMSFTRNQGFLFGRGNQQITAELIRQLSGPDDITIVGSRTKLASLDSRALLVDTGDAELDQELSRVYPILTGYDEFLLYRVARDFSPSS